MILSQQAIDRPVLVFAVTVMVIALGAYAVARLPIERDPDLEIPYILVFVAYPAATPEMIEQDVLLPLEEHLRGLDGVDYIEGSAREGMGMLAVKFLDGGGIAQAKADVKDRVDEAAADLPEDAETPRLWDIAFSDTPICLVSLAAPEDQPMTLEELSQLADTLADRIADVEGIAEVATYGGTEQEVAILADPARLMAQGLTLAELAEAVRQHVLDVPVGVVEGATQDRTVRVQGAPAFPEQLAAMPLSAPTAPQASFTLGDVAQVLQRTADATSFARLNGTPSVTLVVRRSSDADTLTTVEAVRDLAAAFDTETPQAQVVISADNGREILYLLRQLGSSALYGAGIVFLILLVAVGLRKAVLVALAIPLTVLATAAGLLYFGYTINTMTVFSLIVILGMVVDGAVIVGESIVRHVEEGTPPLHAAKVGIAEVGRSVLMADLTTVLAFTPLLFLTGLMGEFMSIMPVVVILALVASVLVDHYVLPTLAARALRLKTARKAGFIKRAWLWISGPLPSQVDTAVRQKKTTGASGEHDAAKPRVPDTKVPGKAQLPATRLQPPGMATVHGPQGDPGFIMAVRKESGEGLRHQIFGREHRSGDGRHSAWAKGETRVGRGQDAGVFLAFFRAVHRRLLEVAIVLRWPLLALLVVVIAIGTAALYTGVVGYEFIPHVDRGRFYVRVETPPGSPMAYTATVLDEVAGAVLAMEREREEAAQARGVPYQPELISMVATGGEGGALYADLREQSASGPQQGKLSIELVEPRFRDRSQADILEDLRARLPQIPDVSIVADEVREGPPAGADIAVRLYGDDMADLSQAAGRVEAILERLPGAVDVQSDFQPTRPELRVDIDPARLQEAGVTVGTLIREWQAAMGTLETGEFRDIGNEDPLDIVVRASFTTDDSAASALLDVPLRNAVGELLEARQVAAMMPSSGANTIHRRNGSRVITVRARVPEGATVSAVVQALRGGAASDTVLQDLLRNGLRLEVGGETEERDRAFEQIFVALLAGLMLVSLALIAYLNSFRQAAVLMLTVPMGFVGVMAGLYLTGETWNILSFVGMVALTGIVVNDAIVLVDYINLLRTRGLTVREAVLRGAETRLRPVFITTVTTIGGLLPLTLGWGGTGGFWRPLCIAIMFGVGFATILTLIAVPLLYDLVEGRRER